MSGPEQELTLELVVNGEKKTRTLKLVAPSSYSLRMDLANACNVNRDRAFFAALGICWRGPGRPKVNYASCDYNPLRYGGQVADWLVEQGYSYHPCLVVGLKAFNVATEGLFDQEEVEAAEGNSDAPAGA